MNVVNPYLKQYKQNQVETASPEKLLILLYDAAIQFLNKAKYAMETDDSGQFHHNLVSCEKILIEFMNTLDMENGGSFAENLYALYNYYYKLLVEAGVSRELKKVDEVLRHLVSLRNTWLKAIDISNSEKNANLIEDDDKDHDEYDDEDDVQDKYVKQNDDDDYEDDEEDDEDE